MEWFIMVWKRAFDFSGRSRRKEYWMFFLFYFIIYIALMVLDMVLGLGFLALVFALAALIPNIAVGIRRLHDTDRSGWWLLLGFVPIVGLVLIYFFVLEGTKGDNRFGPDPKAGEA